MTTDKDLNGLRGWLILVGLGVVFAPVRMLAEFGPTYYELFTNGTFELLTTKGSEYYSSYWAPLLLGEAIFNSAITLVSLGLIYLYFARHYWFPAIYIGVLAVSAIFVPLDTWASSLVLPDEQVYNSESTSEIFRSILIAVIWIPYMLMSKRVQATFVRYQPLTQTASELNPQT